MIRRNCLYRFLLENTVESDHSFHTLLKHRNYRYRVYYHTPENQILRQILLLRFAKFPMSFLNFDICNLDLVYLHLTLTYVGLLTYVYSMSFYPAVWLQDKQGVVLTGRNTTGPPRATPWWVALHMRVLVLQTPTDNRRRQTPATQRRF